MPDSNRIVIIDYRMGNLRSVQKAFEYVGAEAFVTDDPNRVARADKLVLPGVGAFGDGMRFLDDLNLADPIRQHVQDGKPFLGICLGMQLLFDGSEEDAPVGQEGKVTDLVPGLGLVPGRVVRFENPRQGQLIKVPQMGWNTLRWDRPDPLFEGLEQDTAVYFVHSYYAQPADDSVVSAVADYGGDFCASIHRDNLYATQFHPEKSQRVGLRILENFTRL
ncbi:MAG: imidazole glycerol phosphate synthase subunit HisH [Phycisphaeraceae bacterium]